MADNRRFQKISGVYTCGDCGKETRDTGQGEAGCGLCRVCFEKAGLENEHNDFEHETYVKNCPLCQEEQREYKEN